MNQAKKRAKKVRAKKRDEKTRVDRRGRMAAIMGFFAYPPEKVYSTSQTARMAWS